jgi:hypothetical protein
MMTAHFGGKAATISDCRVILYKDPVMVSRGVSVRRLLGTRCFVKLCLALLRLGRRC